MKYIFGPVPSRRLGMSLGVDIIPFKTCSFDCIYCQLDKTTNKSIQRQGYVPKEDVLEELRDFLNSSDKHVDFITISGSGEPTLNSDIGAIISGIKNFSDVPVAVLTNGSLFYREDVRDDLSKADLVVPSLDAISDDTFVEVNRPYEDLNIDKIIHGLKQFTQDFNGKIWLEIMLVKGVNDHPEEIRRMAELVRGLKLDKIHLNTVVRPPAEESALAISAEDMKDIAEMFDERAEVIVDFSKLIKHEVHGEDIENQVLSLLKRRPCTVEDISNSLGIHRNEVVKHINHLVSEGCIRRLKHGDNWYYEYISKV
jgi:wyosine [tRNA(Phe)-imidazoG37] synthetase (radical SAM superfamily)